MTGEQHQQQERENNKALVDDLRKRLLSRGPELQDFDEEDIEKVQKDDKYVWQFLAYKDKDVDRALEMMVDCLKWRETFGVNEITERNIDRHLFEMGFLFPRNKDKNGNILLFFITNRYRKELYPLDEVKKLFAFGLEKIVENNVDKKVTMIFDMQDSGFANMDMDLIKFVIACFQTYFPNLLEYLIVFETPWILITCWKIVKTWMSTEGISKIKFVKKNEITQYVTPENLLSTMGGLDDFVYKYPPQLFTSKLNASSNHSLGMRNHLLPNGKQDVFSSISLNFDDKSVLTQQQHQQSHDEVDKTNHVKTTPIIKMDMVEPIISVIPSHELVFSTSTSNGEPSQILKIKNNVSKIVAFKIKTTSPENYRVKPSSGRISAQETVEINVQLQPGHISGVSKDKFLIMSTLMDGANESKDNSTMWKSLPKSNIYEQRLRCRCDGSGTQSAESDHESTSSPIRRIEDVDPLLVLSKHLMEFDSKMDKIQSKVVSLENGMKILFRLLYIFFAISLLLMLLFTFHYTKDIFKLYYFS